MSRRCSDTDVKSRYIWSAVWVKGAGPASLLEEHGLRERCLAYDVYQIMGKAWDDHIISFGGKLEGNADIETVMPFISLYTAEWHTLSNSELEDRLCHDVVHLASREAEIEERWQARCAIVHTAYDLCPRIDLKSMEPNDEPATESSDFLTCLESGDEQTSSVSTGTESNWYDSEYDERPRRRTKAIPKKKTVKV